MGVEPTRPLGQTVFKTVAAANRLALPMSNDYTTTAELIQLYQRESEMSTPELNCFFTPFR